MPYICFNSALYLFTTLPDREGDELSGKKTLAVVVGVKKIIRWAFIIYAIGFIFSLLIFDRQALLFFILSLPFFLKTLTGGKVADTIRATKYAILFFALSICMRWPLYFLIMVLGFFSTKLYFKKRFDINYPNFAGK
jgi:4-hydroxybenzoate polyprenyltransferase